MVGRDQPSTDVELTVKGELEECVQEAGEGEASIIILLDRGVREPK